MRKTVDPMTSIDVQKAVSGLDGQCKDVMILVTDHHFDGQMT